MKCKNWAIIPARGGSKGLHKKNIQMLGGKPLIGYAIESALQSKLISRVFVSTDDLEIARIAKELGAEVPFLRPAHLATDSASIISAVNWTVDELAKSIGRPDNFVTLLPSHPFRSSETINKSIELLANHTKVTTAVRININPSKLYFMADGTKFGIASEEQSLDLYQLTGTVLSNRYIPAGYRYSENPVKFTQYLEELKQENPEISYGALQVIGGNHSSVDIDSLDDLLMAEKIAAGEVSNIKPRLNSLYSSVIGMSLIHPLKIVYGTSMTMPLNLEEGKEYLIQIAESGKRESYLTGEFVYRKVTVEDHTVISKPLFKDDKEIIVGKAQDGLKITWNQRREAPYFRVAAGQFKAEPVCRFYSYFSLPPLWKCDISTGVRYNALTGNPINGRQDIPELIHEQDEKSLYAIPG